MSTRFALQMINKDKHNVHVEIACNSIKNEASLYQSTIAVVRDIKKMIKLRKNISSKDLLPIYASCKNVRDEQGKWVQVEDYFSDVVFSHGICPNCCEKLYPEFDFSKIGSVSKKYRLL